MTDIEESTKMRHCLGLKTKDCLAVSGLVLVFILFIWYMPVRSKHLDGESSGGHDIVHPHERYVL